MAKKHKIELLNKILLAIIILLILFIVIFSLSKGDDVEELNTISISGMNEVITIYNQEPLKVYIKGMGATVHFSKTSNPKEIYLKSMNSVAYLCKGIHTPLIEAKGMNAKAIYIDC